MRGHPAPAVLSFLFFLSGLVGLILEVTWARRLSFLYGNGVRAAGAVVALTLVGLAVGSRWAGRRADRASRPLAAYSLLEGGVALWAFCTPLIFRLLPRLPSALPGTWGDSADLGAGTLLATALLFLPGTFLMGATTPFVVRAACIRKTRKESGPAATGLELGRLYGWNTLGGAAGASASVFFLLPRLGMGKTLFLAGCLEALVAAGAFLLAHLAEFGSEGAPAARGYSGEPPVQRPEAPWTRGRILVALFLGGALGSICQIAWTRTLILLFGSSAYAVGLSLASCLAGLALGSVWSARLLDRDARPRRLAATALFAAAITTLVSLPVWGKLPVLVASGFPGWKFSFSAALGFQALLSAILILPPAAALGALMPVLTASLGGGTARAGKDAADGYSLDTWGSVFGALSAAYLFLPRAGAEMLLRCGILLELMLLLLLSGRKESVVAAGFGFGRRAAASGLLLLTLLALPRWDPELMTSGPLLYSRSYSAGGRRGLREIEQAIRRRGQLRFLKEGPEATVTVREAAGGILSLQINGKTDASTAGDLPTQLLAGHLPALLHPAPRETLVIGLASGVTAGALAVHPVDRIDCVEISPAVMQAAELFRKANGGILSDPRLRLILGDGRAHLQLGWRRYDLIASQPTNPWIAGVTNLFTREFFLLARERLARGGVLAVWIQGYALDSRDFRGIVGTFLEAFPDAQLWEESAAGGDYFLIGRKEGSWPTGASLAKRFDASPVLRRDLLRAGIRDPAELLGRFVTGSTGLAGFSRGAPRITDDNLRLEFTAPRALWNAEEADLIRSLEATRQSPLDVFPSSATPAGELLRARLEEIESRRRDRIRLALSLRRADWEALSSPALAEAAGFILAGLTDEALPFLREAQEEVPEAPAIPLLIGWLMLDRGDLEEAAKAFEGALARDRQSAEAANGLGLVAWRRGDPSRAAALFRLASARDPSDPDPASNVASVLLASGRETEALRLLDRVLESHPGHVPARINRGVALARLGRVPAAIREYRRALELDPLNPDAAFNLRRAQERARTAD